MDAWEQWSALLVPRPNPRIFTGKKALCRPSSRSGSMSSLSQKRRKLTKPQQSSSPPPEIEPFSFEHEPIIDMATNVFDFSPLPDTSGVNDCTAMERDMSQPRGLTQNITHFPHAVITSAPQSIPQKRVDPNSSFVVSMSSNPINTSQLESPPFLDKCFPNPLVYISRKLTKRGRTTRIPKSASTPLIPSEATPTIDNNPSPSPTTVPILSSPNPSCPPPIISAAINHLHSDAEVTDNPILASSTVPPQHAPQSTFESSRFQAENGHPVPIPSPASNLANPIAHAPGISSACEANAEFPRFQQEYTGRLDISVHLHKPELLIPADITELIPEPGLWTPGHTRERALSSNHTPGPSSSSGPYEGDTDLDTTRRSIHEFAVIPIVSGPGGDMGSEENSNQYLNALAHRTTDGTKNKEILLLPSLNQCQDLHSNGRICVAPSLSTSPMITTPGSPHGGWSSSASSGVYTPDQALSPSTSVEEEGIVGGNIAGVAMGTQGLPLGVGSKPVGSGLMSLARWKWKRSKSEDETAANDKSEPGMNREADLSTIRGDGDSLSRGSSRSSEVYCETPQLISSVPTDNSSITITQTTSFTYTLGPIAHPERFTKCSAETSIFAATNAFNNPKAYTSIKNRPKPKFIIGDSEDGTIEFPVSNTEVREPLEISNTAIPRRLRRRDAINDEDHHCENRRWTLASALTDEKISNAGLVKVLDRMRDDTKGQEEDGGVGLVALDVEKVILEGWGMPYVEGVDGSKDDIGKVLDEDSERGYTPFESRGYPLQTESPISNVGATDRDAHPKTMKQHSRSHSTPSQAWIAAQRALLTCRELILTERHYIAQLSTLVQQQTATPPPPQMCDYAKELLQASERVIKGMENDPSARGVARAFLEREEEVQGAYIRWCEVVGGWFSGDGFGREVSAVVGRPSLDLSEVGNRVRRLSVKRKNRVTSKMDVDKSAPPVGRSEGEDTSLKRTVSTWRKSMPALSFETPALYGGSDRKREKEGEREAASPSARKLTVRELAILPTQRVMRYVLIYQELLSHTPPTSPSRTFVERAAHAAARIAEKCDLAQGNAAFIPSSSSNSNGGGSRTRNSSRSGTPSRVPPLPMTLVAADRVGNDSVPPSPTSFRSSVDSPSRSSTQFFQSNNNKNNTELMTGHRGLSVSLLSLGWGKSNKQKIPAAAESMQAHTAAGVSTLTYPV